MSDELKDEFYRKSIEAMDKKEVEEKAWNKFCCGGLLFLFVGIPIAYFVLIAILSLFL
jgi:hypothetical protein